MKDVRATWKLGLVVGLIVLVSLLISTCQNDRRVSRYRVIERTNSSAGLVFEVPIVLEHDGHKYFARCNNIKGIKDPNVTKHCELHVGMTVECQVFKQKDLGYDLICGSMRNQKGDLDAYGENELLTIDREEN